jgi:hypothetical protein
VLKATLVMVIPESKALTVILVLRASKVIPEMVIRVLLVFRVIPETKVILV